MIDAIAINKADGENKQAAKKAKAEYQNAIHLFPPNPSGWVPKVLSCSALQKEGLSEIWEMIQTFQEEMKAKRLPCIKIGSYKNLKLDAGNY